MSNQFLLDAKFRKLSPQARLSQLQEMLETRYPKNKEMRGLVKLIASGDEGTAFADIAVESSIGVMSIPLGIVSNLCVDGTIFHVPVATEEASVIGAATYAAKIFAKAAVSQSNIPSFISTKIRPPLQIVQISLSQVSEEGERKLANAFSELHTDVMCSIESMHRRGGGIRRLEYRRLDSGLLVVHILVNVQDAMGANIVNAVAEAIAPKMAKISGGTVLAAILSNYNEERTVDAEVTLDVNKLPSVRTTHHLTQQEVAQRVAYMSDWAQEDLYRAVTHNKGIMNAVEGLALATGNDTRALSTAAHSLAATCSLDSSRHSESYNPLSLWGFDKSSGLLKGNLCMPALLATVGGSTAHSSAQWVRAVLGLNYKKEIHAHTLNRVAAGLGLAQNFAALFAIVTQGIQQGHMNLHNKKKEQ